MTAVPCSRPGCRRTTTDPSGTCQDHGAIPVWRPARVVPPPVPPTTAEIHPTGGYNEVQEKDGMTSYRRAGKLHREDGPAEVGTDQRGWRTVAYYLHGELHRVGGPAQTWHNTEGVLVQESWLLNGLYSREGGPAYVQSMQIGPEVVRTEQYFRDGKPHRTDGPAIRKFEVGSGRVHEVYYYFFGTKIPTAEEFEVIREATASGAPAEWVRAYLEGDTV